MPDLSSFSDQFVLVEKMDTPQPWERLLALKVKPSYQLVEEGYACPCIDRRTRPVMWAFFVAIFPVSLSWETQMKR